MRFIKPSMASHSLVVKERGENFSEILQHLEWEEFPLESFPEEMRRWISYYKEQFNYPEAATAMCSLTMLSAAIGPLIQVANGSEHGNTPLNIWTVIIAQRGSGKSHIIKELSAPIIGADREIQCHFRQSQADIESHLESLRAQLPRYKSRTSFEDNDLHFAIKIHRRIQQLESLRSLKLLIGTASCEALKKVVADAPDHFTFALSSEGSEVFSIMFGKYSDQKNSEIDTWLSLKTGEYLNDTRLCRESVTVDRGLMAMLLMVQPSVAERLLGNGEAVSRGLFTRMYFIDPQFKRCRKENKQIQKPSQEAFNRRLDYFLHQRMQLASVDLETLSAEYNSSDCFRKAMQIIPCDPAAQEIFIEFHNEGVTLEESMAKIEPEFPGECSRWREDAIQIAGLLAALEERVTIDNDLARRAVKIVRWCKKNFLRLFLKKRLKKLGDKWEHIQDIIEKSAEKRVTVRDLKLRNGIEEEDLTAIQILYGNEMAMETITPKSGGRLSQIIRIKY